LDCELAHGLSNALRTAAYSASLGLSKDGHYGSAGLIGDISTLTLY
jgi:hypothetical protein